MFNVAIRYGSVLAHAKKETDKLKFDFVFR